ncbi:MAG: glycoside hydrolase family 2 TIM barrel-domain containing protein [Candidatus Sumerlaeia bacterium]
MYSNFCKKLFLTLTILLACSLCLADYVWIEGETPSNDPTLKDGSKGHGFAGWGNDFIISEGKMLTIQMSPGDAENKLPEGGLIFTYDFNLPQAGKQNIWARIGFEWVRSSFQWRVDGGEWQMSSKWTPTVNIQPIQTWNELAWLKLGEMDLAAGKHTIEFRHVAYKEERNGKEQTARIMHFLDAICITPDAFRPNGKYKPDADFQNERDKQALEKVFDIAAAGSLDRSVTQLDGLWMIADFEEYNPSEETRLQPVKELPNLDDLHWYSYDVPKDRNTDRPEMIFSHRFLTRAKVNVPASAEGRGFFLDFQNTNMIVSVFVNGVYCGSSPTFQTAWQCDVSKAVKPGQMNDIVLAIKDNYYAIGQKRMREEDKALGGSRRFWNLPLDLITEQSAGQHMDMPAADTTAVGLIEPVSFVTCGPVYASDVFVKPSLQNKNLGIEIEILNPTSKVQTVQAQTEIIPWNQGQGGKAELVIENNSGVAIQPGQKSKIDVTTPWDDPHLWWPDDPFLYWAVTTLKIDGKPVDVKKTRFGFREWVWDKDHHFYLNGIKWPTWADVKNTDSPQEFVALCEESHKNMIRYWYRGGFGPMTRRETMNYFDEKGIIVRSSGIFDGQRANYGPGLVQDDTSKPKDDRGRYPRMAHEDLFNNWRKQMTWWIREERNHPSIFIWTIENEITYINANNLGLFREVEPEIRKSIEYVMDLDPTRPAMIDGGNCLRDESLPVNGAHYTEFMGTDFRDFPDAAYTREHFYNNLQRDAWRMVPDRPIMKGEVYFANGYSTERFATIGGEQCFIGIGETFPARGLWGKMLSEGWRWAEVSSFHFWLGNSDNAYYNSWSPVAVFCRQWNWTFGENTKIDRLLKVFNNTRYPDPIEAAWELTIDGKRIDGGSQTMNIAPGEAQEWAISFTTPNTGKRLEGTLALTATHKGEEVFREEKQVSILAPAAMQKPSITREELALYDPAGSVAAWLNKRGIAFTEIQNIKQIPASAQVIIVGKDAIPESGRTDTMWYSLAAQGKRVIILDQENPLRHQATPADIRPTEHVGRFGFSEDLSHPIFAGLKQKDFFTWGNDHVVYRNIYKKGARGGRSLFQCDNALAFTALVESQVNDGFLMLSQLAIGDKIEDTGIAQAVFNNMLNYAAAYRPLRKDCYVSMDRNSPKAQLLGELDLKHEFVGGPLEALKGDNIAIVEASPQNLKTLADNKAKVESFCQGGGWLMLWGLTPEGLEDYNKLVGYNHVIRPFDTERVVLNVPSDPLASGLTLRDVVMDTGAKMYRWMALKAPDSEAFNYIIDHTDIAPFAKFPTKAEMGKAPDAGVDHEPRNMVNGFTSDDNWTFTYTTILDQGHKTKFTIELPKEEELVNLRIRPSRIYHPITEMKVYFDDDPDPVVAPLQAEAVTQDVPIEGRKAKRITLEISDWAERGEKNIVVIDNLWLMVKRSDMYMDNVHSLLNIGGLMRYDVGMGGIFLNQLNIKEREQNPVNKEKKSNIVKTILANMGGVFSGGKVVVAGGGLEYDPVKIPDAQFNAYINRDGNPEWFQGPGDLNDMPRGAQNLANVDYFISDFFTSPVPSVFMLKGEGSSVDDVRITDIKVEKKADALFFLHTFNPSRALDRWERDYQRAAERNRELPESPVLFKYLVHYADGKTADVNVVAGQDAGPWRAKELKSLPNAAIAWAGPLPKDEQAIVYSMQWNNPRPDVEITSVDIVSSDEGKWGAPAVLALTAARTTD